MIIPKEEPVTVKIKKGKIDYRKRVLIKNLYKKVKREVTDYEAVEILVQSGKFDTVVFSELLKKRKPIVTALFETSEQRILNKIRRNITRDLEPHETYWLICAKETLGQVVQIIEQEVWRN